MEVYIMLNESVVKLLKEGMQDLATCANGEPNVVPVAFKDVTDDGKLVVGDVFLETTLNNSNKTFKTQIIYVMKISLQKYSQRYLFHGRVPPLYEDYSQKKKGSQYATD